MEKLEFMKKLFEQYNYECEVYEADSDEFKFIHASFRKPYGRYKWCCISASYMNGEVKVDFVTNGGVIHGNNLPLLEESFAEMNECQKIIQALKEHDCLTGC